MSEGFDDYFNSSRASIWRERELWQEQAATEGVSVGVIEQRVRAAEIAAEWAARNARDAAAAEVIRHRMEERAEAERVAQAQRDAANEKAAARLSAQQVYWARVARGEWQPRSPYTWGAES